MHEVQERSLYKLEDLLYFFRNVSKDLKLSHKLQFVGISSSNFSVYLKTGKGISEEKLNELYYLIQITLKSYIR